jgi:hypothetical protein
MGAHEHVSNRGRHRWRRAGIAPLATIVRAGAATRRAIARVRMTRSALRPSPAFSRSASTASAPSAATQATALRAKPVKSRSSAASAAPDELVLFADRSVYVTGITGSGGMSRGDVVVIDQDNISYTHDFAVLKQFVARAVPACRHVGAPRSRPTCSRWQHSGVHIVVASCTHRAWRSACWRCLRMT